MQSQCVQLVVIGAVSAVLVSGCGGAGGTGRDSSAGRGEVVARATSDAGDRAGRSRDAARGVVVDVAGLVRTPGVYELPRGARVHEAIAAAGGVRRGGVLTALNRAAEVVDGQQIVVPGAAGVAAGSGGAATPSTGGGTVSLNSADVAALDALPGIGPVTAQRIVDDRTANGPFASVADLDRVPGIGAGTVADLDGLVTP